MTLERADDFRTVQRECSQVVAVLRRALFSLHLGKASSPVQGGSTKSPSPFGGLPWAIRTTPNANRDKCLGTGKVTDRRNSTLRCYFRHNG